MFVSIVPEFVEEDRGRDRDKVVGELLRTMADSITPMLRFEEDVCSNYQDGKLPILDLKVWKAQSQEGPTLIRHDFYKKPMASQATLRASTAYPTPQLRAIMTEEVLRRLRNCSPESTWEERGKHLTEFALSLKSSGHNEKFRVTVFRKAVARFEKELTNHNEGIADIYRSREERNKQTEADIRRILRESVRICQCRDEATKEKSKDDNVVLMNGKDEFFGVKLVQPNFIQE